MNLKVSDPKACGSFQLSPQLLEALSHLGTPESAEKGGEVFRQGEACRGIFVVKSGYVRISIVSQAGEVVFARILGPGCILGLPATLCMQPYSFTASAVEPATFDFLESSDVLQFLRLRPDLCMEIVGLMSRELAEMNQRRTGLQSCRECGCAFAEACAHHMETP